MKVTYTCPTCHGSNVQLCFPCWVDANDIDDKEKYELDAEASPEQDSTKGFCQNCGDTKLLDREEEE